MIDDTQIVAGLKGALDRSGWTLRELSERAEVPYRSLQNYFSERSRMPAAVYLTICETLGVDNQMVLQGTFHLQLAPLYDALWDTFGDAVLDLKALPNTGSAFTNAARHNRKQDAAHNFAVMISTAYNDRLLEHLKDGYSKGRYPTAIDGSHWGFPRATAKRRREIKGSQ